MPGIETDIRNQIKRIEEEKRLGDKRARQLYYLASNARDVREFGADGEDPDHDDTAAFQAAIDSLPESTYATGTISHGGGGVFFPKGIFKLTSALQLRNNIHILGAGRGSRLNLSGAINGIEFVKYDGEPLVEGCRLANFAISGDGASAQWGIYGANLVRSEIDNVLIRNCNSGGINLIDAIGNLVHGATYIFGCGGYGILVTANTGDESNANTFDHIYVTHGITGVQFENGDGGHKNNRLINSAIEYNSTAQVKILGGYSEQIISTYTEGSGANYGIIIDADGAEVPYDTLIEDCFSMDQYFIQVREANRSVLRNNRSNHASSQIDITADAIDTVLWGGDLVNTISDAGTGTMRFDFSSGLFYSSKGINIANDAIIRNAANNAYLQLCSGISKLKGRVDVLDGVVTLSETTTPDAIADYGQIYTKNDNKLYFKDGAGIEHEIAFI